MFLYMALSVFLFSLASGKHLQAKEGFSRSLNGGYYYCDFTGPGGDEECIFALTDTAPPNDDDTDDWISLGAVEHDTSLSPCGHNQGGFLCQIQDLNGDQLGASPKPWQNGDNIAVTDTEQTGDDWTYTLIFELVAPLRNKMMYHPGDLSDANEWAKYTKAFVDCKVKDEDEEGDHGTAYSVDNIYDIMMNPDGVDMHHFVLQFLEEGAIDLVCITTDLDMDRCDTMRAKWDVESGTKCNCWQDAYNQLFAVDPKVDVTLTDCAGDETTTVTATTTNGATGGSAGGKGGASGRY